ncbi:MAG TPA: trehalose-phosphatase [Nitrospirales bacterium]|nr:trehalose-phosphatase [Nitrospirales bacterium]
MADLLEHWEDLAPRLRAAPTVCVLSDFDGTLTPLVDHPENSELPGATRRALEGLSKYPRVALGVVSGRCLEDLLPRVKVEGLWYVGNHGYEVRSPGGEVTRSYELADVRYIDKVRDELGQRTATIPGVALEHKGPILAVHYRLVKPSRVREVEQAFCKVLDGHSQRLMMARGNMVLEARLRSSCNKGTAVRLIRRRLASRTLVLYFGDDLTDRDAFRELQHAGVSVQVGGVPSPLADFTVDDPRAVLEALERIEKELRTRPEVRPLRG